MKHVFTFLFVCMSVFAAAQSMTVHTFDETVHTAGATLTETHTFPADNSQYSEILMNFWLTCPNGGCDPWDRFARLNVKSGDKWIEIARYITPYGNGNCSWTLDVTEYRELLKGNVEFQSHIETWQNGWEFSADFEFIEGTPEYEHISVRNLWVDYNKIYGDTLVVSNDLPELRGVVPHNAEKVMVRIVNTGHGQGNYMNAAEFAPMNHELHVEGELAATQFLWRDDCGTNICTQGSSSWTAPRAGWCPGMEVTPDDYDITDLVTPNHGFTIDYVLEEYYNLCSPWNPDCDGNTQCTSFNSDCLYNGNTHTQPNYKISAQVIYYSSTPLGGGAMFPTAVEADKITDSGIKLAPNPTNGIVKLEMDHHWFQNARVTVTDLTGKVVWAAQYDFGIRNTDRIDLSNQPPGMYLVNIAGPNRNITEKIILTR